MNLKAFTQLRKILKGTNKKSHLKFSFTWRQFFSPKGSKIVQSFGPVIHLINHNCLHFLSPVCLVKAVAPNQVCIDEQIQFACFYSYLETQSSAKQLACENQEAVVGPLGGNWQQQINLSNEQPAFLTRSPLKWKLHTNGTIHAKGHAKMKDALKKKIFLQANSVITIVLQMRKAQILCLSL